MPDALRRERHTLPRSVRIRSQRVFKTAFANRCRVSDQRITLYAVRNEVGFARLGISVGRRFGSAVARNRAKRLIREAFRQIRHELPPGLDLIVVPKAGQWESNPSEVRTALRHLAETIANRVFRA